MWLNKWLNTPIVGIPEGEKKEKSVVNMPNKIVDRNTGIQKTQSSQKQRFSQRHATVKLSTAQAKERILQMVRVLSHI